MHVSPKPNITKKLKDMAQQQGITLNALVVPFLNDIAEGRLVRVPHYPSQPQK
ncbi:hypothetical protein [Hymenobacter sp. GOD-10R]|uniref:hypothetical protein n=1 Tax=Hymenobacter sp. GOD-10R TaxID=3093922 RepID=UPI002D7A328C|nr:hypothetical protein [Hymenobacter sp. GOD-10R]WRQ26677.1 hypothetical protein SD425_16515 [Hymenobacter sp. GOD-10R]